MRKLIASLFISLDGVVEAPDQWHFPYFNDEMGQAVGEAIAASDSMLLGRRTYEEWAAFWPQQDPAADPFVSVMNETPKFVASTTLEKVEWQNTTPLESIWIDPYPDEHLGLEDGNAAPEARYEQRETIELAFIVALQHLPARQRAVLILREVLGFSAREVAQALDTTAAPVNSALQRARKTVDEALPQRSQQATLRSLGDTACAGSSSAASRRGSPATSTRWCRCSSRTPASRCRRSRAGSRGARTWSRSSRSSSLVCATSS